MNARWVVLVSPYTRWLNTSLQLFPEFQLHLVFGMYKAIYGTNQLLEVGPYCVSSRPVKVTCFPSLSCSSPFSVPLIILLLYLISSLYTSPPTLLSLFFFMRLLLSLASSSWRFSSSLCFSFP
jgi:hypothetical protein